MGALLNQGCIYFVGKKVLAPEDVSVRTTEDRTAVASCQSLGRERRRSAWGGLLFKGMSHEKVVNELAVWAESLGADTLYLEASEESMAGSWAVGTAYRCR